MASLRTLTSLAFHVYNFHDPCFVLRTVSQESRQAATCPAVLPSCRPIILPSYRPAVLSSCRPIALPSCRPIILALPSALIFSSQPRRHRVSHRLPTSSPRSCMCGTFAFSSTRRCQRRACTSAFSSSGPASESWPRFSRPRQMLAFLRCVRRCGDQSVATDVSTMP